MNRRTLICAARRLRAHWLVIMAALVWAVWPAIGRAQTGPSALVLYDAPSGQVTEKMGKAYAIMLTNLLGHWDARVTVMPVQQYVPGSVEAHQAVFYLGSHYDNPLPEAMLRDIEATSRTVVWFKYNLWQLSRVAGYDMSSRLGFRHLRVRSLEGDPAAAQPDFFDTVQYQGEALRKYYAWDAVRSRVFADPDIGLVEVTDTARTEVRSLIENSATGEQAPYILRSGQFWYVADLPLSFIGPRDRYLVLCDLLHEMLGSAPPTGGYARQALVRLEDVSAMTTASELRTLTDVLQQWRHPVTGSPEPIPFSIALIPRYRDPLGRYNGGVAQDIRLRNARNLRNGLDYALARGARLVMHGYTHQYSNVPNPYSAVSGDDFEFWDAVRQQVLPKDALRDWRAVFDNAAKDMAAAGYSAFAFEMPHYQGSPRAYRVSAERFALAYERAVYYTSETPQLGTGVSGQDYAVGQFFPFVIQRDWYGRRVLPENLGNIEYDISAIDATSYFDYTWQDLQINARVLNRVVRDGTASFFFHPFWLRTFARPDGSVYPIDGLGDFRRVIDAIAVLGFRWADPKAL